MGRRISIQHTRALLNAALDGKLKDVKYRKGPIFGFEVPEECAGVPNEILNPANTWGDRQEYWRKYDAFAARFIESFKLFADRCSRQVIEAGPRRLNQVSVEVR